MDSDWLRARDAALGLRPGAHVEISGRGSDAGTILRRIEDAGHREGVANEACAVLFLVRTPQQPRGVRVHAEVRVLKHSDLASVMLKHIIQR